VAFRQDAYTAPERGQIIDAIARGGSKDLALLHVALGERFAGAVLQLLAQAKVASRDLSFIASHGQTIWHEPGRATLQLGDPAVIAERVGVRVVSDFRSRDVAAGGQGAPLVPLADVLLFGHAERGRLLLNIGGMANVTFVPRRAVTGGAVAFDTGPGVAVVDAVTRRIDGAAAFDAGGERARRGKPSRKVLEALLADPYFAAPPPKSTGRERFGPDYAARLLDEVKQAGGSDNDAVATATALTVETIARGIERWTPARAPDELVISGGGARNPRLVELLAARVAPRPVVRFESLFFDGEAKEALVFAFLGFLTVLGEPGNLPAATGARGPRAAGAGALRAATPRGAGLARRPGCHRRLRDDHRDRGPLGRDQLGVRSRVRPRSRAQEPDRPDACLRGRPGARGRAGGRVDPRAPGARRSGVRQTLPGPRAHHAGLPRDAAARARRPERAAAGGRDSVRIRHPRRCGKRDERVRSLPELGSRRPGGELF